MGSDDENWTPQPVKPKMKCKYFFFFPYKLSVEINKLIYIQINK